MKDAPIAFASMRAEFVALYATRASLMANGSEARS
jgi:hypothetical protein